MGRKLTTYTRPSIADQVTKGQGTIEEIEKLHNKMEADGASNKTLKRLRKALAERKRTTPIKRGTFNNG